MLMMLFIKEMNLENDMDFDLDLDLEMVGSDGNESEMELKCQLVEFILTIVIWKKGCSW